MKKKSLHFLITAGPTREHLDPVRYLSNESSGKMGVALATAAQRAGHRVTLICGPIHIRTPRTIKRIDVTSAREMMSAVRDFFPSADVMIGAAAVADFRPAKVATKKIKKKTADDTPTLTLVTNPDIIRWAGHHKSANQYVVGFALETDDLERSARAKLISKQCDMVVANLAETLNANTCQASIYSNDGSVLSLSMASKPTIAKQIVGHIIQKRPPTPSFIKRGRALKDSK